MSDGDHRPEAPFVGSEEELLAGFLDFQRATALWKCEGLSREELVRPHVPSGTSMLGIVKHLAWVERSWFRKVFAGEVGIDFPWSDQDRDADLRIETDETPEQIFALYRRACSESRDAIQGASLDQVVASDGDRCSLRWIMIHMIEETARHNGHLDILRENTDGATGE